MASIGISESTFAITILAEQQARHWADLVSYPILPSLVAEAGAGWDAYVPLIGTPMFMQFKLSDYMSHGKSAHHAFLQGSPYYRFHLHAHLNFQQHTRLRALSQAFPDTYYVAPELATAAAFHSAYISHTITEASRFIPLVGCHDIAGGHSHEIFYSENGDVWQASEPQSIESTRGDQFPEILSKRRKSWTPIDLDFARDLGNRLREFAHIPRQKRPLANSSRDALRNELSHVADTALNLGLHLSIIGSRRQN